jgi:signal transduction histidine kinase/DNA-binding response OmpR family regulator
VPPRSERKSAALTSRATGGARVALLQLVAAVAVPLVALAVAVAAPGAVPAWILLAATAPVAAVLSYFGLRTVASEARGQSASSGTVAVPADAGARMTSPLAIEELRGEIERYRVLERQLTQAKQEAEAAALSKNEFLATVSHEIRTPLNGIIPLLAMLRDTRLDSEQADLVATAQQSARQLLAIVDDILDYSKIEANKLELESVDLSPAEIVEQVARMMAPMAEAKRLRFSVKVDPAASVKLRGDPLRLRQILTNLVSNAIKFTERGAVSIEATRVAESRSRVEIQFVVRDTGVGISPQAQQRLFKSFSQADASTTRVHGGTGLGLAICRRLVELMGGQIGVRSEVGRGSAFWFRVPLPRAPVAGEKPRDLDGLRAMLVSPDPAFVARHERMLGGFSMSVLTHAGGPDLLGNLRGAAAMGPSWRVDVAVLDGAALGMQATTLARTLLGDRVLKAMTVVVVGADPRALGDLRDIRLAVVARDVSDRAMHETLLRLTEGESARMPETPAPSPSLLPADGSGREPGSGAPRPTGPPASSRPSPRPQPRTEAPAGGTSPPVTADPAGVQSPAGGSARILLVEDNPVNRQLAQKLLTMAGYRVDTAENGQLALEALARATYDIVLMDCQMPVMDGYAATRKIRELQKAGRLPQQLPIVAMTANAMIGDREKCLAAGMDDYLTKPLDRALMLSRISHHLALARAGSNADAPIAAAPAAAQPAARRPVAETTGREGPAIDQAVLRDLLDVMGQALADLVRVYLEDAPRLLSQLRAAAGAGDVEGMIAPAHSLKSSSANLGATRLSEQARMIEHGARLKTLSPPLLPPVERIETEFQRVRLELGTLIDARPD